MKTRNIRLLFALSLCAMAAVAYAVPDRQQNPSAPERKPVPGQVTRCNDATVVLCPGDDIVAAMSRVGSGDTVLFKPGVYDIVAPMTVQGVSNLSIRSLLPRAVEIRQSSQDTPVFEFNSSDRVHVADFRLSGPGKSAFGSNTRGAIYFEGTVRSSVDNCEISDFQYAGIQLENCSYIDVRNCDFEEIWRYGIACFSSDYNTFRNNRLLHIGSTVGAPGENYYGISLSYHGTGVVDTSDYNQVLQNYCEDVSWTALDAHNGRSNRFIGNIVRAGQYTKRGITVTGDLDAPDTSGSRATIADNHISGCTTAGIHFSGIEQEKAFAANITGNFVTGCRDGIFIHSLMRANISTNTLTRNERAGLSILEGNRDVLVSGNSFSNNGVAGELSVGIRIGWGASSTLNRAINITGNSFSWDGLASEQKWGIWFETTPFSEVLIASNFFRGHSGGPVYPLGTCTASGVTCGTNHGL